MSNQEDTPRWIPVLIGVIMFAMGALILGSVVGPIPTDEDAYFSPRFIIMTLSIGLMLGAFLFWLPMRTPALLKSILFLCFMFLVAIVCNWSAFAPNVRYSSTTSVGPITIRGEDQIGGRIVFGIVALVLDAILIVGMYKWVQSLIRRK